MKIAVICTGTELLKGCTVNSNLAQLGAMLTAVGLPIGMEIAAGDRAGDIGDAIACALRTSDVLILTGGLGPTKDDITLDVAARFFGCELKEDPELSEKVLAFWNSVHQGHCPKNQFRQARVPVGGHVLPNPVGSASGIAFSSLYAGVMRHVFLLPGPPSEFVPMAKNYLVDELLQISGKRRCTLGFLVPASGESTVAKAVENALTDMPLEIGYTAVPEGTKVFLEGDFPEMVHAAAEKARNAVGTFALPVGATDLYAYLAELLRERKLTFGTAESCTGGLIAKIFTDMPGISDIFVGGVVSYANAVKTALLGVDEETLVRFGAVSEETAVLMAKNAVSALGCDCSIAVTGIAGPDGGTPEKPVGTVYISCSCSGNITVEKLALRGGREAIRQRAAARAVYLLIKSLRGSNA